MKNLNTDWLESLTKRGAELDGPICGNKAEESLKYIGMPVGGIGCGTVYLNGDGRLFVWDVFNQPHEGVVAQWTALPPELREHWGDACHRERNGANYINPPTPDAFPNSFEQGFGLNVDGTFRCFQQSDWADVEFIGTWPAGTVNYWDAGSPVEVTLKAFSPFIPLNLGDSSLPVTCMEYTIRNRSDEPVDVRLSGWLENAVSLKTRKVRPVDLSSERTENPAAKILLHSSSEAASGVREPVLHFTGYGEWAVSGAAFGLAPVYTDQTPQSMDQKGKLISPEFIIERRFIQFTGKVDPEKISLNLVVDGEMVQTTSADNETNAFDVSDLLGKTTHLEICDNGGLWVDIGIGHIVFTDRVSNENIPLETWTDSGSMALAVLNADAEPFEYNGVPGWEVPLTLQPGEQQAVTFMISWHFPNIYPLPGFSAPKRHIAARFNDAADSAAYVAENYSRLRADTFKWVETWYDSTLPEWLMARTLLTADTLQTANCYLFEDGQFWAWEGIGSCAGTCTHVWQYAQSLARLFPSLERNLREVTDYGYAQDPETGMIRFRGKHSGPAVDGQAGVVLRTLREHQMSPDHEFLRRVWPNCKLALQMLIHEDENHDGLLEGSQHNTLDADWYGPVAWLSGEYLAALCAGERMAREMGDNEFAEQCRTVFETGRTNLVARLYDPQRGYFINLPDPEHADSVNTGTGCHIDQVFGQSWAFQVGLDRVLPERETRSALHALWENNFFADVGPWRMENRPGRWYAMPGDGGLVMCTFPTPDWDYIKASGVNAPGGWSAIYLNECMSGFEYQVASHMIYEGDPDLVLKGLAITRAIHDRYSSEKRNPYNEIECSDHYGRAAASYGVFLAACGFEYDGPAKRIGFAPRISPENFKAAFTSAEGWGTYSQHQENGQMQAQIAVNYGTLTLRTLAVQMPERSAPSSAEVIVDGIPVSCGAAQEKGQTVIQFGSDIVLTDGQTLSVTL